MEFTLGLDNFHLSKGRHEIVAWDSEVVVNPHWALIGGTGSGKTYKLKQLANVLSMQADEDFRMHVFDSHGDIETNNESSAMYSETAGYGINPLIVDPDPHFGGVRKCIQNFISVLEKSSHKLGLRQEAVLRNVMKDFFEGHGYFLDDPMSWLPDSFSTIRNDVFYLNVPFEKKGIAKRHGALWSNSLKKWFIEPSKYVGTIEEFELVPYQELMQRASEKKVPTLQDLEKFIYKKRQDTYLGLGKEAMNALNSLHSAQVRLNRFKVRHKYGQATVDVDEKEKVEGLSSKVISAVESYLSQSPTPKTFKDALAFDSYEVLTSIHQRIESLNATGIFKDSPPPFDERKPIFRHVLTPLTPSERKMFVLFSVQKIFNNALKKGEVPRGVVRDSILIDEAKLYFDDDELNALNMVSLEGRKFGIQLICASQAPEHFSRDFLGSVATKLILGVDEQYWSAAKTKLNIDQKKMEFVIPQRQMLAQIKQTGQIKNIWQSINLTEEYKE